MPFFQKGRKKHIVLFSLIFVNLLLISFQVPLGGRENYFERAVFSIFSPVQHGFMFLVRKVGSLWSGYFYLLKVQKQNREFSEEIFLLRQENQMLKSALQQLEERKDVNAFISSLHDSFLFAQVIGVDAVNAYKSITIGRGTIDGIKRDMAVLDKMGNLVGRVIPPISLKECRVQLITDSESGVGVISQKTGIRGVLTGDAEGKCHLKYIYATQRVEQGEDLFTSGLDHIYPSRIKVGTVASLSSEDPLFKKIQVKPSFEFNDLNLVVIIKKDVTRNFLERE